MPHRKRNSVIFVAIASILAALLVWFRKEPSYLTQEMASDAKPQIEAENSPMDGVPIKAVTDGAGSTAPSVGVGGPHHSRLTQIPQESLVGVLAGKAPSRWVKAESQLQKLSPEDQWQVLVAPGISEQPYAKLLRSEMVAACSSTLNQIEINVEEKDFVSPATVVDWCRSLSKSGQTEYLFDEFKIGNKEINNPEWWVPEFNAEELSKEERQVESSALRARLLHGKTFSELRNTITALWSLQSDAFGPSWDDVNKLGRYDRGLLQASVPLSSACAIVGGCGPKSVHTITYCATMPGFDCHRGMGLQDVMRWNLSPRVYGIVERMTVEMRGAYFR